RLADRGHGAARDGSAVDRTASVRGGRQLTRLRDLRGGDGGLLLHLVPAHAAGDLPRTTSGVGIAGSAITRSDAEPYQRSSLESRRAAAGLVGSLAHADA